MKSVTRSTCKTFGLRKISCPALMVGALLLMAGSLQAQNDASKIPSPGQLQEVEAQYLKAIQPQVVEKALAGAIPTGQVILYGQLVGPPYHFMISGDALYLNGVQVDPPLMPPWKHPLAPVTVTEQNRRISALAERIGAAYQELESRAEEIDIHAALLRYVTDQEKTVRFAEWTGPDMIDIEVVTGEEFSMMLPARRMPSNYLELRKDLLSEMKQRYEANLKSGALLALGYGPVLTVPARYVGETQAQIEQALGDRSETELRRALLHDELVREMLFLQDRISKEED